MQNPLLQGEINSEESLQQLLAAMERVCKLLSSTVCKLVSVRIVFVPNFENFPLFQKNKVYSVLSIRDIFLGDCIHFIQ